MRRGRIRVNRAAIVRTQRKLYKASAGKNHAHKTDLPSLRCSPFRLLFHVNKRRNVLLLKGTV